MLVVGFVAVQGAAGQTLHVYGPGGPSQPIKECARLFTQGSQIPVEVTAGPVEKWLGRATADADVVYGGAEYMLTQFDQEHGHFLLPASRVELGSRSFGILVRSGNPKHIRSFRDLARPGMKILDVAGAGQLGAWEDIAGRQHLIGAIQANIAAEVDDSGQAIAAWKTRPELDAWITFVSWGARLPESTVIVRLPRDEEVSRGTPAAIAARSTQRAAAGAFLRFLQTPQAHAVFVRWGWD